MPTTIPTTTSTARASLSPSTGDAYFETDTKKFIIYDGTDWRGWNNDGIAVDPSSNTYSVSFDGTDDYLDLGNLGTAGRSLGCLAMWVKITNGLSSNQSASALFGFGTNSGANFNGLLWGYWSADTDLFGLVVGTYKTDVNVSTAGDGFGTGWNHFVLNHNGTGYDIYINGTIAHSSTLAGGGTLGTSNYTVSSQSKLTGTDFDNVKIMRLNHSTGYESQGLVDEIGLWDDALTSTEISEIYNSGSPISLSSYSPDGWWRMGDNDGGTGATITDQSDNGHDGTLTNGPTFSTTVPS